MKDQHDPVRAQFVRALKRITIGSVLLRKRGESPKEIVRYRTYGLTKALAEYVSCRRIRLSS